MSENKKRQTMRRQEYYDFNLVAVVVLLVCFGLVILYSTSAYISQVKYGNDMNFFGKQAIISAASIAGALFISKYDYHILYYVSGAIYIVSMVLMALVKTPLGVEVNGAKRWLQIGIQFQPSELAKIAVITFMPCLIMKMGKKAQTLRGFFILLITGAVLALGAFLLTENLSTGLIIGAITMIMIFISSPKTRPFLIALGVLFVLVIAGKYLLRYLLADVKLDAEGFRLDRILVWLDPQKYSDAGGYQVMQGLYAIGSGGFFGKGLGNSVQKLGPVPEAQNDMIFSIVCEELGVFGGLVILILFAYLLYRLFFIAQNAPDFYGALMVSGIFIHIALQVILNICVVLNWIPTTGITLPFISYGGTSIVFLMTEMGIALSVSRQIKFEE